SHGILVSSGAKVTKTGAGTLNLGGSGSIGGFDHNAGVVVQGTNSEITANTATMTIIGTGAGSANDNYGVAVLNGGKISKTGAGNLTVNGTGATGGGGTSNNYGVYV